MAGLQHLADLTVFAWAGARAVSKKGYAKAFGEVSGLPATPFRLDVESARVESLHWLQSTSLAELLRTTIAFLEDIRMVCGLVVFNVAKKSGEGELPSLAAEINTPCILPDLPSRLHGLKARYELPIPLEEELLSLHALHLCFAGMGGLVGPGEVLTLRLKMVQPPPDGKSPPVVGDHRRSWGAGERVNLTRDEHAAIFTTLFLFMSTMLETVQSFAKTFGMTESVPAMSSS